MKTTINQESAVDYLENELRLSNTKEDFLLAFWMYWVESVTVTNRQFGQVLANAPVNKWFLMEIAKEEAEFYFLKSGYPQISGKEIDLLYVRCISKLMSRFPLALLANAKKREQRPQTTRVAGILIETSILNQN